MHYLGKPKRRLFSFRSKYKVSIDDSLNTENSASLKSSGRVIRVAKKDNQYYFLATFEVSLIENKIFLNGYKDKTVGTIDE